MGSSPRKPTYDELADLVDELRARIAELERQLKINSQNSSKPPASDAPSAAQKAVPKRRKKRGAQKGHEPHLKALLPPEQVTRRIEMEPQVCPNCGGEHFVDCAEEPLRDQFIELPPSKIFVTEYVRPIRACAACGSHTYAPEAEAMPSSCFGSGVPSKRIDRVTRCHSYPWLCTSVIINWREKVLFRC